MDDIVIVSAACTPMGGFQGALKGFSAPGLGAAAIRAAVERVRLSARLTHRPSELSGGEQQRVALARALIHEPKLIVCDEPTSALDGRTGQAVMELLSAMAVRPDRAVIIVTHDARIFNFADQIAHMDDGRIITVEENRKNGSETNDFASMTATLLPAAPEARSYSITGD